MCFVLQVSAWGGYVFIINLIPLHVFALLPYAALQQEAVHRWVTCDVCMFVWASEVHTSPPTQSHHVVLVLPYNEAWTCFLPHAYWFGHRDACAAVVAKYSKAQVSFCIDSSILIWCWYLMTHFFHPLHSCLSQSITFAALIWGCMDLRVVEKAFESRHAVLNAKTTC